MNSASQNFSHHLGVLRERILHPSDYEKAVHYFLEEFAADEKFVRASDREQMPHLVAALSSLVSKAIGGQVALEGALVSYLDEMLKALAAAEKIEALPRPTFSGGGSRHLSRSILGILTSAAK